MRLGIGHQFRHCLVRCIGPGQQHIGLAADEADRRQVLARVELQGRIHRRHQVVADGCESDRVAVGHCLGHLHGTGGTAGAGPVVDDELLVQARRQARRDDAGDDVAGAAGRIWHDEAHRPARVDVLAAHAQRQ
jgi:hypothetical protein